MLWTLEQEKDLGLIAPVGDALPTMMKPMQLSLFEVNHPVVDELKLIDVETLTPIEALNKLHEMKKKVTE